MWCCIPIFGCCGGCCYWACCHLLAVKRVSERREGFWLLFRFRNEKFLNNFFDFVFAEIRRRIFEKRPHASHKSRFCNYFTQLSLHTHISLGQCSFQIFRFFIFRQYVCNGRIVIGILNAVENMDKYLITSCQPLFESSSSVGLGHASYSLALSSSDLNIFDLIGFVLRP